MPITYPRPHGETDRYDAYRISSDTTDIENILYPRLDGMEIENDDPDLVLCLRFRAVDPPSPDPATEKWGNVEATYDTDNATVNRVRVIIPLTQQGMDDYESQQAANDAEILLELDAEPDTPIRTGAHESVRLRAQIELHNKRINYALNRIIELQSAFLALQSSGGNANSRLNALPTSYLATNTRTKAEAVTAYKDDLPNQA